MGLLSSIINPNHTKLDIHAYKHKDADICKSLFGHNKIFDWFPKLKCTPTSVIILWP